MNKNTIRWGILGVGDVCEIKSGPALQKANNSELLAVMRRNGDMAADFAKRHNVPRWYDSVEQLLADDEINAIYVASPPRFHLEHALAVLQSGKHLYLEKPMAMSSDECRQIIAAEEQSSGKAVVAHYRRALPAFRKIKQLLSDGAIGTPRLAEVRIFQAPVNSSIGTATDNWRWDPAVSGGGLFHDLSPHMLDLMLDYFGQPLTINGQALRQNPSASADDLVQGTMRFAGNVLFQGTWIFSIASCATEDVLMITGDKGRVSCNFFGLEVKLINDEGEQVFNFTNPENIQLPMIEEVVKYFTGEGPCPCPTSAGLMTVEIMEKMSS